MNIKKLLNLFFLLLSSAVFSQNTVGLKTAIAELVNDASLKHATWSVCVVSATTNKIIAEHNSAISMIPASTLKTITTGAALSILGEDFQFKTMLQYSGTFDKLTGVITGNVYIVGGGDPSLGSSYFETGNVTVTERWAAELQKLGVKEINGAVIGDASIFQDNVVSSNWTWGDMGNYYGAGASGLSYRDNTYTVHFKSGAAGTPTSITKIVPQLPGLELNNAVIAYGSSDNAYIYGAPYTNYRMIEGSIPANQSDFTVKGSMPDPALYCAQEFTQSLRTAGITVRDIPTTVKALKEKNANTAMPKRTVLYTQLSPKLDAIIYWLNLKSVNLYAEHMVRYLGFYKTGKGTERQGLNVISAFWDSVKVDIGGLNMSDGSGLSKSNVITTKTQAQALAWMTKSKYYEAFRNSLPVAGKSGSLQTMCVGTSAANNLCAKSGYLTGDRGYAGYVTTKSGELVSFSILANNYECSASAMKSKMEKIMIAIANM